MSDQRERWAISAKLFGLRTLWYLRWVGVIAALAVVVGVALTFADRRSVQLQVDWPAWYESSVIYQDPVLLFGVGIVALALSLAAVR